MLDAFLSGFAKGVIHQVGEKAGKKTVDVVCDKSAEVFTYAASHLAVRKLTASEQEDADKDFIRTLKEKIERGEYQSKPTRT